MDPLPRRVAEFTEQHGLFDPGDRLLVAMSGGLDSTVLFHVLAGLGYDVAACHVNFQLRGEESDLDARFVRKLALTRDAEFYSCAVDLAAEAKPGESTQMVARRVRYNYFEKILDEYNFTVVLTAHHLDDSLETTLINFIRGTGLSGLTGIRNAAPKLRRPLAFLTRTEITEYAHLAGITWREDASNRTDHYLRNRVRHHLVPLIRELGLTMSGFQSTLDNLAATEALQRRLISDRVVHHGGPETGLDISITGLARNLARTLTYEAAKPLGFTAEQCRQVIFSGRPIRVVNRGMEMFRYDGTVYLRTHSPTSVPPTVSLPIPGEFISAGSRFTATWGRYPAGSLKPAVQFLPKTLFTSVVEDKDPKLPLRSWEYGDTITPFGMHGRSKKVQDVFVDAKVPRHLRPAVYLILDTDGAIVCLPGLMVSEAARAAPGERGILITPVDATQ